MHDSINTPIRDQELFGACWAWTIVDIVAIKARKNHPDFPLLSPRSLPDRFGLYPTMYLLPSDKVLAVGDHARQEGLATLINFSFVNVADHALLPNTVSSFSFFLNHLTEYFTYLFIFGMY